MSTDKHLFVLSVFIYLKGTAPRHALPVSLYALS
jgi:hypothetical protein